MLTRFRKPGFATRVNTLVIAVLLIGITGFSACHKDHPAKLVETIHIQLSPKQQALVYAGNDFGFNMLREIAVSAPHENYCISPLSISAALGMTMNGAKGDTRLAMENTLGFSGLTDQEINETYQKLFEYLLHCDPKVAMEIANSIWHRHDFPVLPLFIQVNQQYFNAGVFPANFDDPATVTAINQWVSSQTNGKIPTLLQSIPAQTVMYLINAVYFKGAWKYKFDKQHTQQAPFYLSNGNNKMVDMMKQEGEIELLMNNLFQAVRLPYGNDRYAMVAMMPANGISLDELLLNLDNDAWQEWMNTFVKASKSTLYFPKFKFEYDEKLNDMLAAIGMEIAFIPGLANFTGINPDFDLYISEVKHKTFIDVNEEGTEAAAVTSVGISYTSVGPVVSFDQPFLFFIMEKQTGFVVFSGQVADPNY